MCPGCREPAGSQVSPALCFPVAAGREGQPSELRLSSVAGLIGSDEARARETRSLARFWIASHLPGPASPDSLHLKPKKGLSVGALRDLPAFCRSDSRRGSGMRDREARAVRECMRAQAAPKCRVGTQQP